MARVDFYPYNALINDELPSNNSSKWQRRSTPDRDDTCHSPVSQDWDNVSPQRADQNVCYSKRGPNNLPVQNTGTRGGEQPLSYGDGSYFHRVFEDEYSNYHNHMKNFGNHRYNIHDKNLHLGGPNHPHFINGGGMVMPRHEYHYNRNGHPMDRIPFKNFNRDRPRFFNNGFQPPPPHLDRFHRGEPLNCPNGFPMDRRRPPFRVNEGSGNLPNFNGSPLNRRWSNEDEGSAHCRQHFGSYRYSNGYRYRDRSNCGNGHESGGSNGYEGGSSETQSETEERCPVQPPVQAIFIDNDQYTKIQTPRQEVIFKKNSNQSASPNRTQESVDCNNPTKRSNSSSSIHSKNKKNKSEPFSPSKTDTVSKKESSNSSKKLEGSRKPEAAQPKKNQSDSSKNRGKTGGSSKTKSNSKASKKSSPSGSSSVAGVLQDADYVQAEGKLAEGDECYRDSEDEENFVQEAEAVYGQGISDQFEGYHCPPTEVEDPTLAGVIMQQCYPGGPMVAIPVRWASSLDPTLIPGETALTPLDPAFTHLLDPSFQPLDSSKWTANPSEVDEPGLPTVVIPDTVIPMQHDASGCPVTVQYASMSEGSSLPTSPAGELSDSSTSCPPNTPSTSGNVSPTSPDIIESPIPPFRESSPNMFSGTPNASNSSISMSSASTLCASSSSSTLVSLSSSPVNSGNPSKETSPSSPRTEFSSTVTVTTVTSDEEPADESTPVKCHKSSTGSENESAIPGENECASEAQIQLSDTDNSIEVAVGKREGTPKLEEHEISGSEVASSSKLNATLVVSENNVEPENVSQQVNVSVKNANPVDELAVDTRDGKTCCETSVEFSRSTVQVYDNEVTATDNSVISEEVPWSGIVTNPDDATAHNDVTASAGSSDPMAADDECVMVDENGVKVTVKQGYIMVPILTPYYDPSVLYGYTAAPTEAPLDQSYTSAGSSRKKKKKQNKRRAIEMNQSNYMDADLYAGEPYVTTPDGFLLPMDPTQLCQYPQPGPLYMPAVAQYPFSVLLPGEVPHQYQPVADEGFVSVEHTPQLPEHAPEPLCSDCVVRNDASESNLATQEDCSKFGPLEETEKLQIEEILSEEPILSSAEPSVSTSEASVNETDEKHSIVQGQEDAVHENLADGMTPSKTETKELEDVKAVDERMSPSITENTEQNEASTFPCEDFPERQESIETERCTEVIPPEIIECMPAFDSLQPEPSKDDSSDSEPCRDENIDIQECKNSVTCESSSMLSQSSPNGVEKLPVFSDSLMSDHSTTEDKVNEPNINPITCRPVSHIGCSGSEENNLSNVTSNVTYGPEQLMTAACEEESQRENAEKTTKSSNHIHNSRIRDNDRLNASILRCARDEALESIAEESSGSLSDSSISSEEPELLSQLTAEMESALSLLHSREEKIELPVTQAVKRWIREVTPEKIFTLTSVDESCVSVLGLDESTSSEDDYSEDEFLSKDDSKCSPSSTLLSSTQNDISLEKSPKNVKGNPFGCAQCSKFRTDAITKRVADCSPELDVLEDYDGCSSVSSLSQGPLFSNSNSLESSKSSSRTITPSRSLSEGEDIVDVETEICRCHPSSYKKYYKLAIELDESPPRTTGSQSPNGFAHSQASSSEEVLPLAAEILRSQQHASFSLGSDASSSTTTNSLLLKSSSTSSSVTSSGLGSSVATTPNSSPHRLPLHSSAPRFPFILLPPNVGAETGSASLNSIHCCSIM
ncbi:hypothetical protein FHG87_007832 [Trinorchestia longiramus]|nr:hypothetical protein FHG87_007832 [Trinorchestia longiramus]